MQPIERTHSHFASAAQFYEDAVMIDGWSDHSKLPDFGLLHLKDAAEDSQRRHLQTRASLYQVLMRLQRVYPRKRVSTVLIRVKE